MSRREGWSLRGLVGGLGGGFWGSCCLLVWVDEGLPGFGSFAAGGFGALVFVGVLFEGGASTGLKLEDASHRFCNKHIRLWVSFKQTPKL